MTNRTLVVLVAVAVCILSTEAGTSPKVLDLSNGGYKRVELKRSELLKHGDLSQWEELDLSGNDIDEVDSNTFLGFDNLKKLSLASNSLGTVEDHWFRGTSLEVLDLSNNTLVGVRSEAFSGLNNLRELNLANNLMRPFKAQTFSFTPKLIKLNLQNNPRAHYLFRKVTIPSLEELNMKTCRITNLTMINFENMPNLKSVNLAGNSITGLDEDSLRTNSKLKDLNLKDNNLDDLRRSNLKKVFSPNTKLVVHFDYDDDRCFDCTLNPCFDDAELQTFLCDNPANKTSQFRGVYEWKNTEENTIVTFLSN